MHTINILQLNVRGIISSDKQQIKCNYINHLLISKQIDVLLVQEWCATVRMTVEDESVPTTNSHHVPPRFPIEFFPDYKVYANSTECAILYHQDLSITPIPYETQYHCYPHRNNFHVCGVLLHTKSTDYAIYSVYRPQSADPTQIFNYPFHSDHIIIGGDFNIHHPLWGSDTSSPESEDFVNHLNVSRFKLLNTKTPTREDPSSHKLSCIDLTLSSHNIDIDTWFVNQANYQKTISDHFELVYKITVPNTKNEIYHSTWNLGSSSKWKKYLKELGKSLSNYRDKRPSTTEDQAIELSNVIYNSALVTLGIRNYRRGFKPWWNPKINKLKKRAKQLRRKMEKLTKKHPYYFKNLPKYNQLKMQYQDIQKSKIKHIHHAKQQYTQKINKHLQNSKLDDKYSWRLLNQNKQHNQSHDIPPIKYQNKTHYNPTDQAKILHKVLTNPPLPELNKDHIKFHKHIHKMSQQIPLQLNPMDKDNKPSCLNNPIQKYEILNCIKELDPNKAYGPDKIHNQMLIKGAPLLLEELLILFNNCLDDGCYPQIWNYSNIHPIPKPNKLHSDPANYRPIAVSSCLGKIFEKLLAKRLQHYCINQNIFDNNQCGFQINRCTDDILSTFLNDVYTSLDNKSDTDCIFTDFSKAYDSIWHDGLLYKLYYLYGIKGHFLQCINNFLRNRYNRVLLKKGHSDWKLQKLGLPQGSSLSPILYILYTNDYKIKYNNFVRMGCFADDTAFWTKPATQNRLRYQILQKEINRFQDWTKYWRLCLNPLKCNTINICRPKMPKIHHQYTINGIPIKSVKECKYLGLWLDSHLTFKTHIDKTYSKLQGSLYRVYNLLKTTLKLYPNTIIQIYKCKSRPIVEYASIFYFHKDNTGKLQKLQNRFLRCAFPCKSSTNIQMLHMIANVQPLSIRINKLILRHWCRAKYSSISHPLHKTLMKYQSSYNTIIKANDNKRKFIHQSPLYKAEWIIDTKYPMSISSNSKVINQPITALPIYDIQPLPTNYSVTLSPQTSIKNSCTNFYIDGSCNPNPGMGAYGWYSPCYNSPDPISKIYTYEFPVSINTCEIMALSSLLKFINKNPPKSSKTNTQRKQHINIYGDSLITLQFLNFQSYPKYNDSRLLIQKCLESLKSIQTENRSIHINIKKVKSHTNIQGNNQIDKLVRDKTKTPYFNKLHLKNTSYSVSLTEIHQFALSQWKTQCENALNTTKLYYKYNRGRFTNNIHKILKYGNFNSSQTGIIIRLITQHIELNNYMAQHQMKDRNTNDPILSPLCPNCPDKHEETVTHFLTKCKQYSNHRNKLYRNISKLLFKNKIPNIRKYLHIQFLLFPYLIPKSTIITQTLIWKEVLSYVRSTNRFYNLRFIKIDEI